MPPLYDDRFRDRLRAAGRGGTTRGLGHLVEATRPADRSTTSQESSGMPDQTREPARPVNYSSWNLGAVLYRARHGDQDARAELVRRGLAPQNGVPVANTGTGV